MSGPPGGLPGVEAPAARAPRGGSPASGPLEGNAGARAAAGRRDRQRDLQLVGRVLADKYKVLKVLGQGGFGSVFLVEIVAGMVGQRLALKVLPEELCAAPAFRDQFLNEIRTAMRLVDKHIVQVRDVGVTEDGLLYYTMDYCPGITLAQVLKEEGKLPVARALLIILNALRGLQTAHAAGVIHRDLKPANIMVESVAGKDHVRVLDFGIATAVSTPGLEASRFAGSPSYMPPEQFLGEPVGFYTDTYALGVVLYECVTGVRPHTGSTPREVFQSLKTTTPRSPELLNPEVESYPGLSPLMLKAIEKNPEKRFPSARDLFEAAQAVLLGTAPADGDAGSAPPPEPGAASRSGATVETPRASTPRATPPPSPAARKTAQRIRRGRSAIQASRRRSHAGAVVLGTVLVAGAIFGVVFRRQVASWWERHGAGLFPAPAGKDTGASGAGEAPLGPAALPNGPGGGDGAGPAPQGGAASPGDAAITKADVQDAAAARVATLLARAEERYRQGEWPALLQEADALLAIAPGSAEALTLGGIAALRSGDASGARERLERARTSSGAAGASSRLLGALIELRLGSAPPDLQAARDLVKEGLSRSPDDPTLCGLAARIYRELKDEPALDALLAHTANSGVRSPELEEARKARDFEKASQLEASARALVVEGRALLVQGDARAALERASRSLEQVKTAEALSLLVECHLRLGEAEEALATFPALLEAAAAEKDLKGAPRLSEADRMLLDAALVVFEAMRSVKRLEAKLSLDLARIVRERLDGLAPALAASDGLPRILLSRSDVLKARIAVAQVDFAAAVATLKDLAAVGDPDSWVEGAAVALGLAGKVVDKAQRSEAHRHARGLLQGALQTKELPSGTRLRALYLLGVLLCDDAELQGTEKGYSDALKVFESAEKAGLKTRSFYEAYARAYDRLGNVIRSAQLLRSAYGAEPSPEACLRAARAYFAANPESREAKDLLREGRERFPDDEEFQQKCRELLGLK